MLNGALSFVNAGQLQYHILPGRFHPDFPGASLYNQIYRYWTAFWEGVMRDNGTDERIDPYEFLRADYVVAIMNGSEVVGVHLYSILNLEQPGVGSHPYFVGENEATFLAALRTNGARTAISFEYLTINPDWRKSRIGFSLAPVVVGLGYQIQQTLFIDSSLGRCRQDNGVNRLMTDVGGKALVEGVMMYNTPTDFCHVVRTEMREHPDSETRDRIAALWNARHDWTGDTLHVAKPKLKIAG